MGEIKSQSIKSSLLTYIGFCLGAVNLFLLYPNFFTPEELGLTQVFFAIATPIAAISSLGMSAVVNRFFPYYRAHLPTEKNDLLKLTLLVCAVGFIGFILLAYLNLDFIYRKFGKSPLLVEYFHLLPIYASGLLVFYIGSWFLNNYKFTTYPAFCSQILLRVFIVILILFVVCGMFQFHIYIHVFSLAFWLLALVLVWKLWKEKALSWPRKWSRLTTRLKPKMLTYGATYFGVSIFTALSLFVDVIAVAGLQGLAQTAYFTVAMYFISVVLVPQKAIINISIPFISDAWRRNDLEEIQAIYKKSSSVLLIVGGMLFMIFWINIDEFLSFMPESYGVIADLFLVLGIALLLDMVAGVNAQILANSKKYWRIDTFSNVLLVALLIPLNFFLIKKFGIMGAAYAKLIAFTLFNFFRGFYLYYYEGLVPFDKKVIPVILLLGANMLGAYYLNSWAKFEDQGLLVVFSSIAIKSIFLLGINMPIIYKLHISKDINTTIDQIIDYLKSLFKK